MKKFLLLMSLLILSKTNVNALDNQSKSEKWNLVWSEEFNDNKLDRTKWNYIIGNGFWSGDTWINGWGNNESEYYTDSEKNIKVSDGKLTITAVKESYKGNAAGKDNNFNYTSGKLVTKDLFNKKYGRFEFRAKLPVGKGLWGALWMLPQDDVYGGWAASGEIDMVEGWGSKPDKVAGTLHYGSVWPNNVHTGKDYVFKNSSVNEFHDYTVEWLPGEIRWYVDGNLYQVQNNWYSRNKNEALNYTFPAPFDQEFYMIINLAVGGWFDGEPDKDTRFPQNMEVDYIRVYDLEGGYNENVEKQKVKNTEQLPSGVKTAKDGNFIYNGDFKSENDNWQLLSHFGGTAKYSFDNLNGSKFLKAEISNGGDQPYSVQIIQEVPIQKGNWYKLSFDSKAEKERTFAIKIGGGESRGWAAYHTDSVALDTTIKTYSTLFQMANDTDLNGKVEFHGGQSKDGFWLGNVKFELVDNPEKEIENMTKNALLNGNLIYNGSFDQGNQKRLQFWEIDKTSSAIVKDRKLTINSVSVGTKLFQRGIQLLANESYQLKFKGSSDKEQKINVKFTNRNGDKVYLSKEIMLTKELTEQNFKFKNETKDLEALFTIEFLEGKGNVVIDDILLKKLVDYANIQTVLVDENFETGNATKNWTSWSGSAYGFGGEQKYSLDKKSAKLFVSDVGNEEWSNMFTQGVKLTKGVKYRISFDISSTVDREVRVVIENATYQRAMQKLVATDKNIKNVVSEFISDRDEDATIKVLTGKIGNTKNRPHSVYLDNFKLEIIQE